MVTLNCYLKNKQKSARRIRWTRNNVLGRQNGRHKDLEERARKARMGKCRLPGWIEIEALVYGGWVI